MGSSSLETTKSWSNTAQNKLMAIKKSQDPPVLASEFEDKLNQCRGVCESIMSTPKPKPPTPEPVPEQPPVDSEAVKNDENMTNGDATANEKPEDTDAGKPQMDD